jgi:xylose isomerase
MLMSKFAAILGVYGKPADRFMATGYRDKTEDVLRRIAIAGKQGMVKGLEIIEGEEDDLNDRSKKAVKEALDNHGLALCAVNPNMWGELQWARGTLGSSDATIRRLAVDRVKKAMDLAAELGCRYVGLWPGQDGFDYLFESDYQKVYDWWVSGMQECADHNPQVNLGLEYKPYEPRTHSFISTTPKTLLLLRDIQRRNVGVTLDVGHALYAGENLGEAVALSQMQNELFHIHLNDNYADWDWDMNFASVHLFDFLEMLYWLKRTNYQGWYSIDIFAYRTNSADSVAESLHWLKALMDLVERAGQEKLDQLVAGGDPIAVSRFMRELVLRVKDG